MRVKQIITAPLVSCMLSKLKLFWNRITASRLTTIYFIFSVVHCFVQAFLQGDAFVINAKAAAYLTGITDAGTPMASGFFVYQSQELRFCDFVPLNLDASACRLVWQKGMESNTASSGSATDVAALISSSSSFTSPLPSPSTQSTLSATPTTVNSIAAIKSVPAVANASPTVAQPSQTVVVAIAKSEGDDNDGDGDGDDGVLIVSPARRHLTVELLGITLNGSVPIVLNGYGFFNERITLSSRCVSALNWPVQQLDNTKREDLAFMTFQLWVLGMSVVALLNESIPHIIASLLTHLSATAWGALQLAQTKSFQRNFSTVVTNGVCGVNLLPTYWNARAHVEIPSLALNCAALFMSLFLSWRLIKTFGWQTFKRVGASRTVNRVYKLVLTLSVTIQLCLFFVVVSVALWLDQICNGAIGRMATRRKLYEGLLIVVLLFLPVWLVTGWYAVRLERKIPMSIFLALSLGYIVGWGAMFDSTTFRWTFIQWEFFSAIIVLGVILVIICFVVGIFCRLNFGRGLLHYLNAEELLPGDDFERVIPGENDALADPEKFDFPTNFGSVPTYEVAFGYDDDVPPPPGARTLGPRFYMQENAALTVDTTQLSGPVSLDASSISLPPPTYLSSPSATIANGSEVSVPSTHSRTVSNATTRSGLPQSVRPLVRKDSAGSQRSYASTRTANSSSEGKEIRARWVIE